MARTVSPLSFHRSASFFTIGDASRQGTHQVAQKYIRTVFPRRAFMLTWVPSIAVSVSSGTSFPMIFFDLPPGGVTSATSIAFFGGVKVKTASGTGSFTRMVLKTTFIDERIVMPMKSNGGSFQLSCNTQ